MMEPRLFYSDFDALSVCQVSFMGRLELEWQLRPQVISWWN